MTSVDYFRPMEFQIWTITPSGETKIGSGGLGGSRSQLGQGEEIGNGPDVST